MPFFGLYIFFYFTKNYDFEKKIYAENCFCFFVFFAKVQKLSAEISFEN